MKKIYTYFLPFLILICCFHSYAQTWQWGRGSTGALMDSWPVATDPSGNVFVAGFGYGVSASVVLDTYSVPISSGAVQTIIAKYDAYGNFLWANATQDGNAFPIDITTDKFGNLYIFGSLDDYSITIDTFTLVNATYPNVQYFLAKLDPSGHVLWAKTDGGAQAGGAFAIGMADVLGDGGIATDTAGNVYIACNFNYATVTVDTFTLTNAVSAGTSNDILIAKYNSSGNVVWAKSFGGDSTDNAFSLTVTPAGDIYIGGEFRSSSLTFGSSTISNTTGGLENAFIARFNNSGTPKWACGSGGTAGDFAAGVATDAKDNVYLTGGFLDHTMSFSDSTVTNPNSGTSALFLVKFDSTNHVSWEKSIYDPGGTHNTWGYTIAMSACNNVWVGGSFSNEVSIDGHILTAPAGNSDPVYIAGYSFAGVYAGSTALSSGADDQLGIACDQGGNIYICADYLTDSTLVIGTVDTLPKDSTFSEWLYVAKYTPPFTPVLADTTFQDMDTTLCEGILQLNAPIGYYTYLWSNDSTGTKIKVDSTGNYWVIASTACASIINIDTFKVKYAPTVPDTLHKIEDTSICKGTHIILTAAPGYTTYLWDNGSADSAINVSSSGTYWVVDFTPCSTKMSIDTFTVAYDTLNIDTLFIVKDTSICKGQELTFSAPPGFTHYLWSDAGIDTMLTANKTGIYWVTATTPCITNMTIDTFKLKVIDLAFSLGNDTVACSPFTLSVPLTGVSFLWQNGNTDSSYIAAQAGTYYVTASKAGCNYSDTINVTSINVLQQLRDTALCRETFLQYTLNANVPEGAVVIWSTGDNQPSISVSDTGIYWVTVSDSTCVGSDTMKLSSALCNCIAFLPNAFTPNNDGLNDAYYPNFLPTCTIATYSFSIYNRFGQQVFTSDNPGDKWNGTYLGAKAETGTYMYYLKYSSGLHDIPHETKGDLTLIR